MRVNDFAPSSIGRLLGISFGFFFASLAIFVACGFTIVADGFIVALRTFVILGGIAYLLRQHPFLQKLSWTITGIIAYALLSAAGVMLSFSAAITAMPLQDALMIDLDRHLGYDWRSYGEFVKSSILLTDLFKFSYFSLDWQPIIIVAVLAFRNEQTRILSYIASTMLALVFTMAIFAVAPVTTAWTHGTPADVSDAVRLSMNDSWVGELERLRDGQLRTISWGIIGAVVGFPSFHCIAALVNSWHLWRDPGFRFIGLPLNVSLIASSLILGGHYMVDLIAGLFVSVASIYAAQAMVRVSLDPTQLSSRAGYNWRFFIRRLGGLRSPTGS